MDLVFCELCFAPVHSGEQHRCFFLRSDEDVYSIPNPNESEEKGTMNDMLQDVNSGNIHDGSVTIYSNFGEKKVYADLEVFSQPAKNNEHISLLPGSTRKTKYPACFAGDINNTWSLSSCDNLLLDSNMIIQECTLNTRENKSAPKSSFGSENTVASPTTLASTGFLMCQKNWDESETPKILLDTSIATRADTGSVSSNLNAKLDLKQSQEFMKNAVAVAGVSAIRPRLKNPAKKRKRNSDLCPPKLKNEAGLVSHEGKRARQKRFECNICEKRFSCKSQLDTHRRTHTGEKPYGCDYCDRRFNRKSHLQNHRFTHTGEKPYGCDHCDRRFSQKANLDSHHRRVHTGEKLFKCEICKKDFAVRSNLRRRAAEAHTQEKPFKCGACGMAFETNHARNQHRKENH